jgi:hypothetical protein
MIGMKRLTYRLSKMGYGSRLSLSSSTDDTRISSEVIFPSFFSRVTLKIGLMVIVPTNPAAVCKYFWVLEVTSSIPNKIEV